MKPLFFLLLFANVVLFLYEIANPSPSSINHAHEVDLQLQSIQLPNEAGRIETGTNITAAIQQQVAAIVDNEPELLTGLEDNDAVDNEPEQRLALNKDNDVVEVDVKASADDKSATQSANKIKKPAACFKAGLFDTLKFAKQGVELLGDIAIRARVEVDTSNVEEGFWVLYPAEETLEQSRANLEMLASEGLKDLWLFERGPLRGAISLGWFRVESYATVALEKYRQQGFAVEMEVKSVSINEYSILIQSKQAVQQLKKVLNTMEVGRASDFKLAPLASCDALES